MERILTTVLDEHQEALHAHADQTRRGRRPPLVRPLSIYILTDGVWQGGGNPEVPMLGLVETLKNYNLTRNQVGIQFISFGDDAGGLERMHDLDEMSKGFGLEKSVCQEFYSPRSC